MPSRTSDVSCAPAGLFLIALIALIAGSAAAGLRRT
jgi:hypothetical protein